MISTLYVAISFPPIERQDDVNRRSPVQTMHSPVRDQSGTCGAGR